MTALVSVPTQSLTLATLLIIKSRPRKRDNKCCEKYFDPTPASIVRPIELLDIPLTSCVEIFLALFQ